MMIMRECWENQNLKPTWDILDLLPSRKFVYENIGNVPA